MSLYIKSFHDPSSLGRRSISHNDRALLVCFVIAVKLVLFSVGLNSFQSKYTERLHFLLNNANYST